MEDLLRGPSELGHPALDPDELNLQVQVGGMTEGAEVRIQSSSQVRIGTQPGASCSPYGSRRAGWQEGRKDLVFAAGAAPIGE